MSLPPITIIPAGAGSGKTYTIQKELSEWIIQGLVAPDRIVAVTFTEAAASELRDRIRRELLIVGRVEDAMKLDEAYISTIHGFGLRVLSEFAFEAGISPSLRLLNEKEQESLIRRALASTDRADDVMKDLGGYGYTYDYNNDKGAEDLFRDAVLKLINLLRSIGKESEDEVLISSVQKKIASVYGKTADANSLKKELQQAAKKLLKKFPNDLSDKYEGNNAASTSLRRDFWNLTRAAEGDDLDSDWKLWQELRDLRCSKRGCALPDGYDDLAADVMTTANALPTHPGPLKQELTHAANMLGASLDSLTRYAREKNEKGLIDYFDMLAGAQDVLTKSAKVLETLKSRIDCLIIDEFQDTNPLQFSLLWALKAAGVPTLIVGDFKQAIMGFQNADPRLLEELQRQHPKETKPLEQNWRSTPALMACINSIGTGLFEEQYTALAPKADYPSSMFPLELIHFPERAKKNEIRAQHTAVRIEALLQDSTQNVYDRHLKKERRLRGGDIAILCPTNSRLALYADVLRSIGIRSRIVQSGWFDSPVIRAAYHALCYVADPSDRHAALYLVVTELGQCELQDAIAVLLKNQALDDPIVKCLDTVISGSQDRSVETLIQEVIAALRIHDRIAMWPDAAQSRANLIRLVGEAREFQNANREALASAGYYGSGLKTFLSWLRERKDEDDSQPDPRVIDEDAVQLTTWHSSKGKEWPVVAVCGLDGEVSAALPNTGVVYDDFKDLGTLLQKAHIDISSSFDAPETNEGFLAKLQPETEKSARRLLYVAVTRAREKLILEWPDYLKEEKPTYWSLLKGAARIEVGPSHLMVNGKKFDCRITKTTKESPPEFEEGRDGVTESLPVIGRRAIVPGKLPEILTPEAVTPSSMHGEGGEKVSGLLSETYGTGVELTGKLTPMERGSILHRCFEILGSRDVPVEVLRRGVGYDLSEEEYASVKNGMVSFEAWIANKFSPLALHREAPVLTLNSEGSVVSGVIDLLLETKEGIWIIDHKTDTADDLEAAFVGYFPQLVQYREAVQLAMPEKKVLGVGINWIKYGKMSLSKSTN